MSEDGLYRQVIASLLAGFPEPPPMALRPSATVIPWRRGEKGRIEVFWVQRSTALGFLGGWHAFPGGGISRQDAECPVYGAPRIDVDAITQFPTYDLSAVDQDIAPGIIGCALRELFEETGILCISRERSRQLHPEQVDRWRRQQAEGHLSIRDVLKALDDSFLADRLTFAGRWITPPISFVRFDTRCFLLEWPADEPIQPVVDQSELSHGEWIAARDALARWHDSDILAAPPTIYMLEVLAEQGPEEGLRRLIEHGGEETHPNRKYLETRPGILAVPLLTPTLPPARETTSYIVGREEAVLIDVGSPFASEIDRLSNFLEHLRDVFGKRVTAIWLTHHHADHVWGVERLRNRWDVPVFAHRDTAERVSELNVRVDGFLEDDQELKLGRQHPLSIRVLHTPGHAKGHLAFWEPKARSLIAGDLTAGRGTILIDPPDGHMGEYLQSLHRILELNPKVLMPAHGSAIQNPREHLAGLIEHRRLREQKIEDAISRGLQELPDLVKAAYQDVDPSLHLFAERQALAHMIHLRETGKIT